MHSNTDITIGLLRMTSVVGTRRDFLPQFTRSLIEGSHTPIRLLVERGYGSDLDIDSQLYEHERLTFVERDTVLTSADVVVQLTAPPQCDLEKLSSGQYLLSMLHFPTHPSRNRWLYGRGIRAVSIDEITDYEGSRIVEDLARTAWNAVTAGFVELRKLIGENAWFDPERPDISALILGAGPVGRQAAAAALRMGNTGFRKELDGRGSNPLVDVTMRASLHTKGGTGPELWPPSFFDTDCPHLLVDATLRADPRKHLLHVDDLARLTQQTVIVDAAADRYGEGGVVKGMPGIPTGDENGWVFNAEHPAWTDPTVVPIEQQIATEHRRTVVSHYAWPSYGSVADRQANIGKYGHQLVPIIHELVRILSHGRPMRHRSSEVWSLASAIEHAHVDHWLRSVLLSEMGDVA